MHQKLRPAVLVSFFRIFTLFNSYIHQFIPQRILAYLYLHCRCTYVFILLGAYWRLSNKLPCHTEINKIMQTNYNIGLWSHFSCIFSKERIETNTKQTSQSSIFLLRISGLSSSNFIFILCFACAALLHLIH